MFWDLSNPCWSIAEHSFFLINVPATAIQCEPCDSLTSNGCVLIWVSWKPLWKDGRKRVMSDYLATWSVATKWWGEWTFFHSQMLDTWQWLMATTTQLALLFPVAPAGIFARILLWKQAGSRWDNFTLHESCGLGTCPSTHYTDPNNVHQHLDQGAGAAPFPPVHMFSTYAIILQQHRVPGTIKLQRDWYTPQQEGLKIKPNPNRGARKQGEGVIAISPGIARLRL